MDGDCGHEAGGQDKEHLLAVHEISLLLAALIAQTLKRIRE
jgi:hypothetical protein